MWWSAWIGLSIERVLGTKSHNPQRLRNIRLNLSSSSKELDRMHSLSKVHENTTQWVPWNPLMYFQLDRPELFDPLESFGFPTQQIPLVSISHPRRTLPRWGGLVGRCLKGISEGSIIYLSFYIYIYDVGILWPVSRLSLSTCLPHEACWLYCLTPTWDPWLSVFMELEPWHSREFLASRWGSVTPNDSPELQSSAAEGFFLSRFASNGRGRMMNKLKLDVWRYIHTYPALTLCWPNIIGPPGGEVSFFSVMRKRERQRKSDKKKKVNKDRTVYSDLIHLQSHFFF